MIGVDGPLHTAVETPTYLAAVKRIGLFDAERQSVLDHVMSDPASGDLIRRSGGVRKVRIAKDDTGKSGGYRVSTYFVDRDAPVFLLLIIDKSEVDSITDAQASQLRTIAKAVKEQRVLTSIRSKR
ncbi:type II toxin-antitoxin system RelE/ParE family toxin [uncultured Sphingomonas sp.]|uniref:type II toxin-antitoxin system RelE/ParE family toxin n=1 Tax=uncultured Sphingomonas sp. TaxID=158754 RepID=UPI0035CB86F6